MGRAAAFSFYPGQESGRLRRGRCRHHRRRADWRDAAGCCATTASRAKYFHDIEGYNGRLDAIQAGILRVKLRHLAKWNEQRRERARAIRRAVRATPRARVIVPRRADRGRDRSTTCTWCGSADRERVQRDLGAAGIGTGIHYPIPLHLAKPYEALGLPSR